MSEMSWEKLLGDSDPASHLPMFINELGNPVTLISGASEMLSHVLESSESSATISSDDLDTIRDAVEILERGATQLVMLRQGVLDYLRDIKGDYDCINA